jgi:hypothetical protein
MLKIGEAEFGPDGRHAPFDDVGGNFNRTPAVTTQQTVMMLRYSWQPIKDLPTLATPGGDDARLSQGGSSSS